ncbi:MAG: 50S ribosomal protein L4 [Bacteroidales bacterium]|nr:50S ribosomal protein L4 [Bacteroidales bacterium]MCF8333820.1 50S ribosomal protein L4 [Bacteroidales bacterium]
MEIEVYNIQGQKTDKKVTLNDQVFGIEPNQHAIYMDTRQYMANQRKGTHNTKERNAIKGSTAKIKRQKGTGTARSGSIKSPIFRGGGRIFGPRPRDYSFRLNKKIKRLARRSALSAKARDGELVVVEDFQLDKVKTKEFYNILRNLQVDKNKVTFIVPEIDQNLALSSRNVSLTRVRRADSLNTYDILDNKKLVVAESSVGKIEELLAK